jgi:TonB family protein
MSMRRIRRTKPDTGEWRKAGFLSLLLHVALAILLTFNLKPAAKGRLSVYHITLRPFSSPGGGTLQGNLSQGPPGLNKEWSPLSAIEKPGLKGSRKESEIGSALELSKKRAERKVEKSEHSSDSKTFSKKVEKLEKKEKSLQSLQEAIDELRKRVALDRIQERVARRRSTEKGAVEDQFPAGTFQEKTVSSSSTSPSLGPETGTRTGLRIGTGTGTRIGTGPVGFLGGVPWGSSELESKLTNYYSRIWEKIKKGWTLPENIPKEKRDLEAIIVIIIEKDGKIQKSWFEKRSGNVLYDQMAMRAIKKAEPFPPIPKEFSDTTFEIGIRFHPD